MKEQVAPPAVLSPQVGMANEDKLKRDSAARIQKTEEIMTQIDQKKLSKEQQDSLSTIQTFLANAKDALAAQDFLRAFNLADKAQILTEELYRKLQ
ncbi:MAG TPA: hypothetical protein VN648_26545 [Candidatus Methylomirabilis sp.]|nr:hypothetical protein [Candidatus Methylomirabilis sp.]